MTSLTFAALGVLVISLRWHDLPCGRALHRVVVAPLLRPRGLRHVDIALIGALLAAGAVMAYAGGTQGVASFATALPEALAWAQLFEIGTLIEVGVAAIVVAARWRVMRLPARPPPLARRASRRRRAARLRGARRPKPRRPQRWSIAPGCAA